jgi:hypothetical protein
MNAGLAKPIHAIWFIRARAVDLDQRLLRRFSLVCRRGCATIHRCLTQPKKCCGAQSKNYRAAPSGRAWYLPSVIDIESRVAASELTAQCDTSSARAPV